MARRDGRSGRIRLLGGASLEGPAGPLEGPAAQRHRLALLALLVRAPGRTARRDKLLALLWPESDEASARGLLNTSVYQLRKALGAESLRSVGDGLVLVEDVVGSDVLDYERHLEDGRLADAARAYGGPFMDGFHLPESEAFERWIDDERARLTAVQADTLETLANEAEEHGDPQSATEWWRRLAEHDPYSPRVAVGLMRALDAVGERPAAVAAGEAYVGRLADDLGLEPDEEIGELLSRLRSGTEEIRRPERAASGASVPTRAAPPPREPGPEGIEAEGSSGSEELANAGRSPPRRPAERTLWTAAAIAALVGGALFLAPWQGVGPDLSPDTLLIVPFEYSGPPGLEHLGEGMVDLVGARLEDGPEIQVLRPRPLLATWGERPSEGTEARLSTALTAARGQGAGRVLLGSVTGTGDRLALTGRLVDVTSGRTELALQGVEGPRDSLLTLIDAFSSEVLLAVSERRSPGRRSAVSNRPLESVHAYVRGQAAYRRGLWTEAADHFQIALEADSTFARAALGLALAESFSGNDRRWNWAIGLAERFGADLTRGESLIVEGLHTVNLTERQRIWTTVTGLMPQEPEGWYELGDLHYHWGALLGLPDPTGRALRSLERALVLDSTFAPALHHVVEILAVRGDHEGLKLWAPRYFSGTRSAERTGSALGWLVADVLGDSARSARARDGFASFRSGELARVVRFAQVAGGSAADARMAARLLRERAASPEEYLDAVTESWVLESNLGRRSRADSLLGSFLGSMPRSWVARELVLLGHLYDGGDEERARAAIRNLEGDVGLPDPARDWSARCLTSWWALETAGATERDAVAQLLLEVYRDRSLHAREFGVDVGLCALTLRVLGAPADDWPERRRRLEALDAYAKESAYSRPRLEAASLVLAREFEAAGAPARAMAVARRRQLLQQAPYLLAPQLLLRARLARRAGLTEEAEQAYRAYLALRRDPEPGPVADTVRVVRSELEEVLAGG